MILRRLYTWFNRGTEAFSDVATDAIATPAMLLFDIIGSGVWMTLNTLWVMHAHRWDPYPFILLNLVYSEKADIQQVLMLISQKKSSKQLRIIDEQQRAIANRNNERILNLVEGVHTIVKGILHLLKDSHSSQAGTLEDSGKDAAP